MPWIAETRGDQTRVHISRSVLFYQISGQKRPEAHPRVNPWNNFDRLKLIFDP